MRRIENKKAPRQRRGAIENGLGEGILILVEHGAGLVKGHVGHAQHFHEGEQGLAHVLEGHGAMVGIVATGRISPWAT